MKPSVLIITGISGSGKSVALRALEDSGYFCVDNLPPQLIDEFIRLTTRKEEVSRVGIGIDIREKEFLPGIDSGLKELRGKYDVTVIFLEAETDVVARRYRETRRPHPVAGGSIQSSIEEERQLVEPLRAQADKIIDTTALTPHQLREMIKPVLGLKAGGFQLTLMSFGYKFGSPQNADLVLDARFLPNPFFVAELKELCGADKPVRDYVLGNPLSLEFISRAEDFLKFLLPLYRKEGKSFLTVAIGCTGGKHRSPVIAEALASRLRDPGLPVNVVHRDI